MSRVLVTGAGGFIGSHLLDALAAASPNSAALAGIDISVPCGTPPGAPVQHADVRSCESLRRVGGAATVVHLAAKAESVVPFSGFADLVATNVTGTVNVADSLDPCRVVFASSSAVYGTVLRERGAPARWSEIAARTNYGLSKAMAELALRDWARERGSTAVALRFGNVIGAGCRGLISHLVEHAVADPEGRAPVQLRGGGRIVRDYVRVDKVCRCIERAMEARLRAGRLHLLNVGSGRGLTNREVAHRVCRVLADEGYRLRLCFDNPPAPGEPERVVLDVDRSLRILDVSPDTRDEVVEAIDTAVRSHLRRFREGAAQPVV